MPIKHTIETEPPLLKVRRWGAIATQDEERACRNRLEDPSMKPGLPVLVDACEVEPPDTVETIRYVADCVSNTASHLRCGPVAIVVSSDVEYGMGRMYMAFTEISHPQTAVFRDVDSAHAWLAEMTRDARYLEHAG